MSEKILTLHPDEGKKGVNIDKDKYELVKNAVIDVLTDSKEMTFTELFQETEKILKKRKFEGSAGWYITSIKLDLEARGVVMHNRKTRKVQLA